MDIRAAAVKPDMQGGVFHVGLFSPASPCTANNIAISPAGLDQFDADLASQAANQHFQRISFAVAIGAIDMLNQFMLGNHAVAVVNEIGDHPIFEGRELQRRAINANPHLPWDQTKQEPMVDDRAGMPRCSAQHGAQAGQQFFDLEGFGEIVVSSGINPFNPFAPAATGR